MVGLTETPFLTPPPGGLVGQIVFSAVKCLGDCEPFDGDVAPIYLINSDGSDMRQIYKETGVIGDLTLSPGGSMLAFTDDQGRGTSNVYVLDIASERAWSLASDEAFQKAWRPKWVSDDELVFIRIDGVGSSDFQSNIYLTDVNGDSQQPLTDRPPHASITGLAVSPDGSHLLFAERSSDLDKTTVYLMSIDGAGLKELITFPGIRAASLAWSPEGDRMVIHPDPSGSTDYVPVYMAGSNGSRMTKIATLPVSPDLLAWTENQTGLIFHVCNSILGIDRLVEVQSDGSVSTLVTNEMQATPVGATPCSFGALSPERRQFVFHPFISGDADRIGLYIMEVPGGHSYQILSGYRVQSIMWSPKGNLFKPE